MEIFERFPGLGLVIRKRGCNRRCTRKKMERKARSHLYQVLCGVGWGLGMKAHEGVGKASGATVAGPRISLALETCGGGGEMRTSSVAGAIRG